MKKNVTYIAREKFETIMNEKGLKFGENAGFLKCDLGNGYFVYPAKTKSVGRVDVQWASKVEGVRELGAGERFGRIAAQLDFGRTEAEILASFALLLDEGMALAKYEKPKKVQPGTVVAQPVADSSPETADDKEARKASLEEAKRLRAEKIRQVAQEMGVGISPKAEIA